MGALATKSGEPAGPVSPEPRPFTSYKILRASDLPMMLVTRDKLAEQIKLSEEQKRELDAQIMSLLGRAKTDVVLVGEAKIAVMRGVRSTLSKERLVELGVDPGILRKATVVTENKPYVRVTRPRGEREEPR